MASIHQRQPKFTLRLQPDLHLLGEPDPADYQHSSCHEHTAWISRDSSGECFLTRGPVTPVPHRAPGRWAPRRPLVVARWGHKRPPHFQTPGKAGMMSPASACPRVSGALGFPCQFFTTPVTVPHSRQTLGQDLRQARRERRMLRELSISK